MMYAKSFMALDDNDRLIGARTARTRPDDRYRCPFCGSALMYHPNSHTERPWFEHTAGALTENGRHHCPYVKPEHAEIRRIAQLLRYVPDARPLIKKADWLCTGCNNHYHGERYCLMCQTGKHSRQATPSETTLCEC